MHDFHVPESTGISTHIFLLLFFDGDNLVSRSLPDGTLSQLRVTRFWTAPVAMETISIALGSPPVVIRCRLADSD
jgi:hypothetical protein